MAAAQHVSSILSHFNQQNLALALWAFAKLGWRPPTSLLADACRHALLTMDVINPQNLSNILWALATMDFTPPTMLLEVCLLSHLAFSALCRWATVSITILCLRQSNHSAQPLQQMLGTCKCAHLIHLQRVVCIIQFMHTKLCLLCHHVHAACMQCTT